MESIPKKQYANSQHSEQLVVTLGSCCEVNQFDIFYVHELLYYALFHILLFVLVHFQKKLLFSPKLQLATGTNFTVDSMLNQNSYYTDKWLLPNMLSKQLHCQRRARLYFVMSTFQVGTTIKSVCGLTEKYKQEREKAKLADNLIGHQPKFCGD